MPVRSPARLRTTTLGKLFTPMCLDADSLRYYMESENRVPLSYHKMFSATQVTMKSPNWLGDTAFRCANWFLANRHHNHHFVRSRMQFTRYSDTGGYNNEQEQRGWFKYSTNSCPPHTHKQTRTQTFTRTKAQYYMGVNATGTLGGCRSTAEDARIEAT